MQPHVKNYFKAFGYDQSDTILCEVCGARAIDIHHVEPRSKFGSKRKAEQDAVDNLCALCRSCHDKAHSDKEFKERLKQIVYERNNRPTRTTNRRNPNPGAFIALDD